MRALFGCLAVLLGAVSISLAARYGYKGADTVIDGSISAVVFGSVACCAFMFDAAAVRLWFMGRRIGSVVIGLIAAAAFVVTFTNSLGAIAGRADITQAERMRVSDAHRDDRAELKRLQAALAVLPTFTPTDGAAVEASRRAADTATANKVAECGDGSARQRGPNCRQREIDEQAAATILANTAAAKSTTDRAAKLAFLTPMLLCLKKCKCSKNPRRPTIFRRLRVPKNRNCPFLNQIWCCRTLPCRCEFPSSKFGMLKKTG